jgi:hypothetical protein
MNKAYSKYGVCFCHFSCDIHVYVGCSTYIVCIYVCTSKFRTVSSTVLDYNVCTNLFVLCLTRQLKMGWKSTSSYIKVTSTNDGRVLDASLHILSRGLMNQSASITCCMFALVAVFVLCVKIMFVVNCVNIVFVWSSLLVFSIRNTAGIETWKMNIAS